MRLDNRRLFVPAALFLAAVSGSPGKQPEAREPIAISDLPGAEPFPERLRGRLAAALVSRGADSAPRTRHRDESGAPKYTNRLLLETSPYLLQHAHNPVNWYPWGDEAFEEARRLNRPVLLSIGYSTCHWCHVMEEESFEDEEIATYLNANYVAIKVDREERPDLDAVYMRAVQLISGRGGWPMTAWLTCDRRPFFGGTYFPARDGDRGHRKGFLTLLRELREAQLGDPDQLARQAARVTNHVRDGSRAATGESLPGENTLRRATESFSSQFDPVHGGVRRAPSFPSSFPVRFMLRRYRRTGDQRLLDMADLTLSKMAAGGIHDQIGGGFHRYSTDGRWLVPHFEKMLYDNALLVLAYLEGYQATGREEYRRVVEETLRYVSREMTSPEGGFYSATDADSPSPEGERVEGRYFTWTPDEIRRAIGTEAAEVVEPYYGVTPQGNFGGRSILHVASTLESIAGRKGWPLDRARGSLDIYREQLYAARSSRHAPQRDDKILTSWNALMIAAFARAGFVLDRTDLTRRAGRAASFVLDHLRNEGRLLSSRSAGRSRQDAFLDDHAFLVAALLDLYEATFELRWMKEAIALQRETDR